MTPVSHVSVGTTAQPEEVWTRWGWLMGGIWLFFFTFPLVDVWTSGRGLPVQLVTTALIAGFMACYVATLRLTTARVARGHHHQGVRAGIVGLLALITLALGLAWLVGAQSMTSMPFIVGLPVFFLPWRGVWILSLSLFTLGVAGSWSAWGLWPSALLWGISVLVLALSALSRYLEEQQETARESVSRLALSEERERVARDVHDVLGHSLTVVSMKTELAKRLIDSDPERAKQELAEVQDLSRQALAEIRATVGGLRITRLADEVEAARMALAGAGVQAQLPRDLTVVDPRHRITLAWVLREAITNVVRHSRADHCVVELFSDGLTVVDDGRGLNGSREGNGLRGLRERVEGVGGALAIGPGLDGRGTKLEVTL